MKFTLTIAILFMIFSCSEGQRNDNLEEKNIEIQDLTEEVVAEPEIENIQESVETFINITEEYPNLIAVDTKDSNLDLDESTEQFIILVNSNNLVTLVVADFNKITREYFVAWEAETSFIYNSDFSFVEQDILADNHNMQLVVTGTTINNNSGLNIYRKSAPPRGIHIYYKNIFSFESTGTIELIAPDRSLDYTENKKDTDKAYSIAIEQSNILNENTVAITKESWVWDRRRNIFFRESSETNEQKINVKDKLRNIYYGNKSNFLNFISGDWLLTNTDNTEAVIVLINSKDSTVTFNYEDGVESYRISSFWNSFKKLRINLVNIEVSTIPLNINVSLETTDSFILSSATKIPTLWDGEYTRINNEIKSTLISDTNTQIGEDVPFTGIYKNVSFNLNFSNPTYTKTDMITGEIEEGVFSLFKLDTGVEILQLRAKGSTRSSFNLTNYQFWYTEQVLESQIIRTIKLHEGVLTTHGIEIKSDLDPIKFEQTEVLSKNE